VTSHGTPDVLRLTNRERQVLLLHVEGLTMTQIAERLGVAPTTARQRGKDACHRNGRPTIRDLGEAWSGGAAVEIIEDVEARRLARQRRQARQAGDDWREEHRLMNPGAH
jgi:IS30 family transposase